LFRTLLFFAGVNLLVW